MRGDMIYMVNQAPFREKLVNKKSPEIQDVILTELKQGEPAPDVARGSRSDEVQPVKREFQALLSFKTRIHWVYNYKRRKNLVRKKRNGH